VRLLERAVERLVLEAETLEDGLLAELREQLRARRWVV